MTAESDKLLARLPSLAKQRDKARLEHERATARLRKAVVTLVVEHGLPEQRVAKAAGIGRQTLRVWRGKDRWPGLD
jgi:transposase-like protein